jgi:hypothetical protein
MSQQPAPVLLSPDKIRALGFEWPGHPVVERQAVMVGGDVDLTATLDRLQSDLDYCERQSGAAGDFGDTWGAPMDDVTDRLDEYAEGAARNRAGVLHIRSVLEALAASDGAGR